MRYARNAVPVLAVLVAAAVLSACGSSTESGDNNDTETVSGQLKLIAGAPSDYADLSGEATLERAGGGTTVSLTASGLLPSSEYVAHLHSGGCQQSDPGGPHFKFDPKGSDEPPNEIHLEFSSNGKGEGTARASSDREVPVGEAGSVVLHAAGGEHAMVAFVHEGHEHGDDGGHAQSDKIACADLEAGGGSSAASTGGEGGGLPTIVIQNGEPVGGIRELEYNAGDTIRFKVDSDVADEVHFHGYDVMKDVPAGGSVTFDVPAEIEGIFEVELEGRKEQIAEIRVNP